jgi:hypothetical protein
MSETQDSKELQIQFIGGLEERVITPLENDLLLGILQAEGASVEETLEATSTDWSDLAESFNAIRRTGFASGHILALQDGEEVWSCTLEEFLQRRGEQIIGTPEDLAGALRHESGFYLAIIVDGGGVTTSVTGTFEADIEYGELIDEASVHDTGVLTSLTLADDEMTSLEFETEEDSRGSAGPAMALFYTKGATDWAARDNRVVTPAELRALIKQAEAAMKEMDSLRGKAEIPTWEKKELKEQVQKEIPFEIFDCGFFKNSPGWSYQLHTDTRRTCAINILMCNNSQDFVANFVSDNFKETINIPYVKDVPILINTKKFHRIKNLSTTDNRFVLSIGHETYPYEITKNMFTL